MNKLHCFHTNVTPEGLEPEFRLITLWREAWTKRGVEPVVLSEWHARQHPMFTEFDAVVSKLPTVNNFLYERACWIRWLALAQVGGGFISDYDVFPKADGDWNRLIEFDHLREALHMFQKRGPCPSFNYASKEVCEWICREIMNGDKGMRDYQGRPHTSDQYFLCDLWTEEEKKPEVARKIALHDYVLGYMDEGWEKARMVHFSNSAMSPRGRTPRWKHIPELLKTA